MRFLHTADWQLGLKLSYVKGERAAQLRFLRFQTVRKLAELAHEHKVDAVLVPGDILDDNAVGKDTLQMASDAMAGFDGIPTYLLPGNHDAATPDSALLRLSLPASARVLTAREAIRQGEATLYACPLTRRHEMDDPTGWLPVRQPGDGIRIALAHGGVIDFAQSQDSETPNLIDSRRILEKGFDYLALGDWHSQFSLGPRVWYPGAHEPTRFKETNPGYALLVEIDAPGALPKVTPIAVAQTRWVRIQVEMVQDSQVEDLRLRLDGLPEKGVTLVQLEVTGALSLGARDALDALVSDYGDRLAYLRANLDGLAAAPTDADLANMRGESFIANGLDRLRSGGDAAAEDAIRLLYRLQREASHAAA